jgi:hypothetical protein
MRGSSVLASSAVLALLACAEQDPPPLYVDVDYQVRCIECDPRAPDDAARRVRALDAEAGFTVECRVEESRGDRLLTFSVRYEDKADDSNSYGLSLVQANLDAADPGGSCRVTVFEGSNTYEGHCSAELAAGVTCQVELGAEAGIVTGSILCREVENKNAPGYKRHVVAPSSTDPAEFKVHGCVGL